MAKDVRDQDFFRIMAFCTPAWMLEDALWTEAASSFCPSCSSMFLSPTMAVERSGSRGLIELSAIATQER